jgi:hypothetical protein
MFTIAPRVFLQRRKAGLRAQENPVEIGLHHRAPAGEIRLLDGSEIGHARVVDQRIQTPEPLDDLSSSSHRRHLG